MAWDILRKLGFLILMGLKGVLQVVLFLFKLALNMVRVFLLLFTLVARIFLVLVRVAIPE